MASRPAFHGRALELIGWWAALVGIWVVTLSSVNRSELAVSTGAALPCAAAAVAARRAMGTRWRGRLRWASWLLPLPGAVLKDTVLVLSLPLRQAARGERWDGELRELSLPTQERAATSSLRRALATVMVSSTPGTFVVDAESPERRLVVHSLVEGTTRMEEVVSR